MSRSRPKPAARSIPAWSSTCAATPPAPASTRSRQKASAASASLSGQALVFSGRTPVAIISQTIADPESLRQACAGALIDQPKDKVEIGSIIFGRGGLPAEAAKLTPGLTRDQVIAIPGKPEKPRANPLEYPAGPKTIRVCFSDNKTLLRVTEALPGGIETILVQ